MGVMLSLVTALTLIFHIHYEFYQEIRPMTYYKKIDGRSLDRRIVETASTLSEQLAGARMGLCEAQEIVAAAMDGGKVTDTEHKSLNYVLTNYDFTEEALMWISKALPGLRNQLVRIRYTRAPIQVTTSFKIVSKHF